MGEREAKNKMQRTNEEQRTTNTCEESDGLFHRWEVERWIIPLTPDLPHPILESGEWLPRATGSVIFRCTACRATHWQDVVVNIDYSRTYNYLKSE
tara:strand:- start:250 stop:537 length:288 start_codon:yes stop_codon:yes gene_type:complete